MSLLRDPDAGELTILTATSGDTGSAVAHAFHNVAGVRVVVLFPREEVSERQRRQMTTLGDNVHAVAVDGTFDTCQALVKQAFADPALSDLHLTSANSINIGRLLPQAVYYVHAYAQLVETIGAQPLIFAVPSGNFGNMFGAMIAKQLGVPVKRVVAATNANDAAPRFFETSAYAKISPSRNCLSNAMNVGHPSNFARLVALYDGWLDDAGALRVRPDLERLSQDVFAVSIDDDDTLDTLARVYRTRGVLLEPHGAVGWAGLEAYDAAHPEDGDSPRICVETAHPAKFPDSVARATGITPTPPPALAHLDERAESYERIAPDYAVCTHLLRSICA
jgi:threonine synthase